MEQVAQRLSWRRLPWVFEVVSIGIGYAFYSLVRVLAPHHLVASYQHAAMVENAEKRLGVFRELGVNEFLSRHDWLGILSAYYYATLHFIITPLLLVWLWRRRSLLYSQLRSALVIATAAALVVYATWPLAPPRFAIPGAVDTVLRHPVIWASGHGVKGLINDLAAMPSLHVGWALWCAVAIVAGFRSRWRHLAWLYPLGTTFVVVATANHYVLDALGGAFVVGVPLLLCGLRPTSSIDKLLAHHVRQPVPAQSTVNLRAPEADSGTAGCRGRVGATRE
jgi:hypothetical protein